MKIKISKSQWEGMGKKAGWIKKSQTDQLQPLDGVQKSDASNVKLCPKCKHDKKTKLNECEKCKYKFVNEEKVEASKKQIIIKKSEYSEKMMPGQTPYTDEEKKNARGLISDAIKGDPGEEGETEDPYKKMRTVRVIFNDGKNLVTSINGTKKEILKYYMPYGNRGTDQDFDNAHPERVHHVVKVEFLD